MGAPVLGAAGAGVVVVLCPAQEVVGEALVLLCEAFRQSPPSRNGLDCARCRWSCWFRPGYRLQLVSATGRTAGSDLVPAPTFRSAGSFVQGPRCVCASVGVIEHVGRSLRAGVVGLSYPVFTVGRLCVGRTVSRVSAISVLPGWGASVWGGRCRSDKTTPSAVETAKGVELVYVIRALPSDQVPHEQERDQCCFPEHVEPCRGPSTAHAHVVNPPNLVKPPYRPRPLRLSFQTFQSFLLASLPSVTPCFQVCQSRSSLLSEWNVNKSFMGVHSRSVRGWKSPKEKPPVLWKTGGFTRFGGTGRVTPVAASRCNSFLIRPVLSTCRYPKLVNSSPCFR